jgi:aminoglycoside phosphotransferase (APT) family kinase protein
VTIKSATDELEAWLAEQWPGTALATEPTPLTGGFWASMYRVRLTGQPPGVPAEVVYRIAPDRAMGAKEAAVQRSVAAAGYPTPHVRLTDIREDGVRSVMDFAAGTPPLGDLDGVAALRRAPALFARLPVQLARTMAALHELEPGPISIEVERAAPTVAWSIDDVLDAFSTGADALDLADLAAATEALRRTRPDEPKTVICHGDFHPFNLLVGPTGELTVIDWTGAVLAAPAFDVAFTAMLLANPPLAAPKPLAAAIRFAGARLAGRFVRHYQRHADADLGQLRWYQALHGIRLLLTAATHSIGDDPDPGPFDALTPPAAAAVVSATGIQILTSPRT